MSKDNKNNSPLNSFSSGFTGGINLKDAQNIRNSMGKNSYAPKYGRRVSNEDDEGGSEPSNSSKPSLEEKDGLQDKGGLQDKNSLGKKDTLKKDGLENKKEKSFYEKEKSREQKKDKKKKDKDPISSLKSKLLKIKIIAIACGVLLAGLLIFIIISYFLLTIDNFFTSITTFFGIAEGKNSEGDEGLYTDERYYYDDDGTELNAEELVNKLHEDNNCKNVGGWQNFTDWISRLVNGGRFSDPCELIRYIQRKTSKEYNNKLNTDIDKGLIIATIFYGFDSQRIATIDEENDKPPASDHFEALKAILTDKSNIITTSTIDTIVQNAVITKEYKYYSFEVEDGTRTEGDEGTEGENPDNPDEGTEDGEETTVKTKTAYCKLHNVPSYNYSLTKWKIFMRFGEAVAEDYEEVGVNAYIYNNSADECKGLKTIDEIREQIQEDGYEVIIDSSVQSAIDYVSSLKGSPSDTSGYEQKADVDSKSLDVFSSVNGKTLDYKNGFAYNHFPAWRHKYDSTYTPKEIETMINEIVDRKLELNDVLLLEDMDYVDVTVVTPFGLLGGACKKYLSTGVQNITVSVLDCDGNKIEEVPFEEYIIGVANIEVGSGNDDYIMAEMLAAITKTLYTRSNYSKGAIISMRSCSNELAYCNIKKGCTTKQSNTSCGDGKCTSYVTGGSTGKHPDKYDDYQKLYEKASEYLVIKAESIFNIHYDDDMKSQWKKKATSGMAFNQIIAESYEKEEAEVIKCNDTSTGDGGNNDDTGGGTGGNPTPHDGYDSIAPNLGKFKGFAYKKKAGTRSIEIDPAWKKTYLTKLSIDCPGTSFGKKSYTVNVDAKSNFTKALQSMCSMLTTGVTLSDGTVCKYTDSDFSRGEVQVSKRISTSSEKVSLHAYGLAQDWNYDKKYTINGKTYQPYGVQRQESLYRNFVKALGKEEDCRNVNYILWKYAYQPAGFNWGGNWKGNVFDGMHFEVKY